MDKCTFIQKIRVFSSPEAHLNVYPSLFIESLHRRDFSLVLFGFDKRKFVRFSTPKSEAVVVVHDVLQKLREASPLEVSFWISGALGLLPSHVAQLHNGSTIFYYISHILK